MWWTNIRKMTVSGGLTVLALILALIARKPSCYFAAAAMALSTFADGLLAGYPAVFAKVKDKLVKGGLIFFVVHILYIIALVKLTGQDAGALLPHFWGPFVLFAFLTALHGAFFYFRAAPRPPIGFFAAAFFYLLTVGAHAAAAVCASGQLGGKLYLNILGAVLFFLSDAILLAHKYGFGKEKRASDAVWFTYAPAQLFIILGFFLAS